MARRNLQIRFKAIFGRSRRPEIARYSSALSAEAVTELQGMIQRREAHIRKVSKGREPTHDEIVNAAWGNLAAEDPRITIDEVREGLARRRVAATR